MVTIASACNSVFQTGICPRIMWDACESLDSKAPSPQNVIYWSWEGCSRCGSLHTHLVTLKHLLREAVAQLTVHCKSGSMWNQVNKIKMVLYLQAMLRVQVRIR